MPKPKPVEPGKVIDPRHNAPGQIDHPKTGPDGRSLGQKPLQDGHGREIAPGRDHAGDFHNAEGNIRDHDRGWDNRDHGYQWNRFGDRDMMHHWDGHYHWWGFYLADVYFWTIYYNDYYWWYDPYWHRYCYQRDGRWWWQNPDQAGEVYVYQDGSYYQYNDTEGGVVMNPDPTPPVDVPPGDPTPADPNAKSFYSADGARSVQVSGDSQDAYLYDTSDTPAFEPKYMASGVTDVRFQLDGSQQLSKILLLQGDSSFSLFDKNGDPAAAQTASLAVAPQAAVKADAVSASTVGQGLEKSAAFTALKLGSVAW